MEMNGHKFGWFISNKTYEQHFFVKILLTSTMSEWIRESY